MEKTLKLFAGAWTGFLAVAILQLACLQSPNIYQKITLGIFAVCLPFEILIFLGISLFEATPVYFEISNSIAFIMMTLLVFAVCIPILGIVSLLMGFKVWLGVLFLSLSIICGLSLSWLMRKFSVEIVNLSKMNSKCRNK